MVYGTLHIKDPLPSLEKSRVVITVAGFSYITSSSLPHSVPVIHALNITCKDLPMPPPPPIRSKKAPSELIKLMSKAVGA